MAEAREAPSQELVRSPHAPRAVGGRIRDGFLRLVDSGLPDAFLAGDPDVLRRARIILSFTLVLIVLGVEAVLFFAWALSADAAFRVELALAAGLALTLAVPSVFRRTGSLALGANLVIAASYGVTVTSFSVIGGVHAQLLHWCALMPMLAVLMGARRSAWVWAGIALATVALLVSADAAGWRFDDHVGFSTITGPKLWVQRFLDVSSWIGILLAVGLLYEAHKENQTTQLALKNAALESQIEQTSAAEERTRYLAYYDELTTLPNRRLFEHQLDAAIERAARSNRMVAVLFVDLDGFKVVNDMHGHALGDRLLQQVAGRLRTCVRVADTVARGGGEEDGGEQEVVSRLGGDEFTMLLANLRDHREAAIVARRVLNGLEEPFALGDHEIYISASIGIALQGGPLEERGEVMRNADLAMYHAKARGKNNFQFFEESMNTDIVRRSTLAGALRKALERDEFSLHFQPIVDAQSLRIVSVEALARWNHGERGVVPAAEFIAIAEESGLIVQLGEWVIGEACHSYDAWRSRSLAPPRISVNVSSRQFRRSEVVETVRSALARFDLPATCLELEVTEGAMMLDEEEATRCLQGLAHLGVSIALDDFGTGYSSLSYVKRFPVDSLKIDRSFVAELETDGEAQTIAAAIIAMAHGLGLQVVAEGVETEAQEKFLRDRGCDALQGYRFGRPMPGEELLEVLARQAANCDDCADGQPAT